VHGNVVGTTCDVPQTVAAAASYSCSFDAKVGTSPPTHVVTGTVSDDDGGSIMPSDSATVSFQ
jgi:hypothetical protein